jgi:hypothetical protein
MRYLLILFILLVSSCELFEEEESDVGICVVYELTFINNTPIYNYDCWNDIPKSACSSTTWYLNQSCDEFCEEKLDEEYTLCNIY